MANIQFPRKEIEKEIKLSEDIVEKINLFGTSANLSNEFLEIEVYPNRPDLLSLHGFIRAFKAFIGKNPGLQKYKVNPPEKNYKIKIDKSVNNIRPFTACAVVKNLSFNDESIKEIIDFQEKIHSTLGRNRKKLAMGIYPIEKINFPIKYEARKPKEIKFMPLESSQDMTADEILNKHPTGREYAHLLQNLEKYPVFVDAKGRILSMPPIINSNDTGRITTETKEVFIECSGFDFNILKKTLNIIVTALTEIGGKIYAVELDYGKKEITPNLSPEKIKINFEKINKILGLNLKEKDFAKLLPMMGYDYKKGSVLIPAYRTDILHEVDITEDIAIAYGYNNLSFEIPQICTVAEESKESKLKRRISEILIGLGFIETSSFHFIKEEEAKLVKFEKKEMLEVENSKTEYKILRPNLLIPMLRIMSENKDNEYPQNLFEIGAIFKKDKENKTETSIIENNNLIISLSPGNFTKAKQNLDNLMRMLSIEYKLEEANHNQLIEGRTGKIIIDNKSLGFIGEIHPETLHNWNLTMPISVIEINLDEIFNLL